jgi:hypothetical protein
MSMPPFYLVDIARAAGAKDAVRVAACIEKGVTAGRDPQAVLEDFRRNASYLFYGARHEQRTTNQNRRTR